MYCLYFFSKNVGNCWSFPELFGTFQSFLPDKRLRAGVGEFRLSQLSRTKSRRKFFLDIEMDEIDYLLQIVKDDPSVVGVLVRIGESNVGVAQMQERRNLLKQLVDSGKEVICYGKVCSTGAYMVGMAEADRRNHKGYR